MFMRVFKPAISIAAAITGLAVLFGFLAPWLAVADSMAHFRFHLTAVVLLLALALAALRSWRRAGLAAAAFAIGVSGMAPALPVWRPAATAGHMPALNIVQLNLSFRNGTPEAVAAFLRGADADVVTLQEVTARTGRVIELLAADYPNIVRCPFARVGGVAVLSRLPRAAGGAQGCAEGKGMAWMRVMAGGQELSVASLHLHWPWPFRQHRQIGELEQDLRAIPRPVLLAGDFNAAPWSNAVDGVAAAVEAAPAPGLRFSYDIGYVSSWAPMVPVPIDHILLPAGLMPLDVRLGPGPGSDHRSIVAHLALAPAPKDALARK